MVSTANVERDLNAEHDALIQEVGEYLKPEDLMQMLGIWQNYMHGFRKRAEEAQAEVDRLAAENAVLLADSSYTASSVYLEPATRRVLAAVEYAESHVELDDMRCEVRYDEEIGERICERAERANTAYRALREDTDD